MKPRSVTWTPHSARPMSSTFTARPAAISTAVVSIFRVAPFASTSSVTLSLADVPFLTLAPAITSMPRFLYAAPDLPLAAGLQHSAALHDRDLVLFHQELDALRILVADTAGTLHRDAVIGLDAAGVDPKLLRLPQQLRDVGRVEQRLGGDAADVHAYPTELVPLDHRGAHAELRGADRRDVAGRPPT